MRSFCVECGKEGPVYEGLCRNCWPKKRRLVELPPVLDLVQCVHCGRYDLPGGWGDAELEEALQRTLAKAVKKPRTVEDLQFYSHIENRETHEIRLRLHARVKLPEFRVEQVARARVRRRRATCPECGKRQGQYYEAILQVRATNRPVEREEMEAVRDVVEARLRGDPGLFVAREERVHGGLDLYLSSNKAAKALAQRIGAQLGGRVTSSPKLHTRRGGRDVYRVTYAVRLPPSGAS